MASGSDNPLTSVLHVGDTFTYKLTAAAGMAWSTIASGFVFPGFALPVSANGTRVLNYSFALNNAGSPLLAVSGTDTNAFTHLGVNFLSFPAGLQFDQFVLGGTILPGSVASTTISSLLPVPGQSPDVSNPHLFVFGPTITSSIPEPAAWLTMIAGFLAMGSVMRWRKPAVTSMRVRYS